MKILISFFILISFSYSLDDFHSKLKECSSLKNDDKRLECYDILASSEKPKTLLQVQGEELTASCTICHGTNWELSTNGERIVNDMTEKEILNSLMAYKLKKKDSFVMVYHMAKYSKKEIELMSKYISSLYNKD